jgi:hypothetical protein
MFRRDERRWTRFGDAQLSRRSRRAAPPRGWTFAAPAF